MVVTLAVPPSRPHPRGAALPGPVAHGRRLLIAPLVLIGTLWSGTVDAVGSPAFTSHRAFYEMSLGKARRGTDVTEVQGALAFEWAEGCEGYTVQQRAQLAFFYEQGDMMEIGWTFTTFEAKDGRSYRFAMNKTRNGETYEEIEGEAEMTPGEGGRARFTLPEEKSFDLAPGTMFPSAHTLELVAAAKARNKLLLRTVFDGASMEPAAEINAVIGPRAEAGEGPVILDTPLTDRPSWAVRLAFFPTEDPTAVEPEHEQTLQLQDDGIVRRLLLDYGDFTVDADLARIEAVPTDPC